MKLLLIALLVSVGLLVGSVVTDVFRPLPLVPLKVIALHSTERDRELLDWVLQWTKYPKKLPVPVTRRLTRRDLRWIFCWAAPSQCEPENTDRLLGFFDNGTETVYVIDTIDTCLSEAVVVHEYTHYVQHYRDGSLEDIPKYMVDEIMALREREAYKLKDIHEAIYCK